MLLFCHARECDAWQVDVLRRSIERCRQPGELVVRSDEHPERYRYAVLDRLLAFDRAMRECSNHSVVAILDPDQVVLRPLEPELSAGEAMGQPHPFMEYHREWVVQLDWVHPGIVRAPLVDWPVILSSSDARRLAPEWLAMTEEMARDPVWTGLYGWMLDQWTFCATAYRLGIHFDTSRTMRVIPGQDAALADAWTLHYHGRSQDFDKRTYTPGDVLLPHPEDGPYEALRRALI